MAKRLISTSFSLVPTFPTRRTVFWMSPSPRYSKLMIRPVCLSTTKIGKHTGVSTENIWQKVFLKLWRISLLCCFFFYGGQYMFSTQLLILNFLIDWLTDWLTDRLTAWLACWLTDLQTDWVTDSLTGWPTDWQLLKGRWVSCLSGKESNQKHRLTNLLNGFVYLNSVHTTRLVFCVRIRSSFEGVVIAFAKEV